MSKLDEAREEFSRDLYATELSGITIEEVGEDYAKCAMRLTDKHRNAYGGIMGGAIYTLADLAFAVASNFGRDMATVSLVGTASFLSMTKGSILNDITVFITVLTNPSLPSQAYTCRSVFLNIEPKLIYHT